jgi:hypothetical protein
VRSTTVCRSDFPARCFASRRSHLGLFLFVLVGNFLFSMLRNPSLCAGDNNKKLPPVNTPICTEDNGSYQRRTYQMRRDKNLNFDIFCKKTLCQSKTAITSAYDVGIKKIYMKKCRNEKLHPNLTTYIWSFGQFLDNSNSKEKMDFFLHI